ncbi:hypothetical protein LX99_01164 [Mucilaginibacter oryzae]|uniref:Uncharacterized protein n=1 Tax=Mucilaginibacter oryzae TaxID=468058 RepID=A0A316HDZ6_9SPHI|nr:hypothetical protein [Mucilaginibacter oryzae]PWK78716.1 hypothetical protein LX99_01164 [Mucilaginibacter oryzae]
MEKDKQVLSPAKTELLKEGRKRSYKERLKWIPGYIKYSKP